MRISDWSSDVCSSDLFIGEQRRGVGQIARKNEPYEEQSQQGCTQRYGEQLEPPPAPHLPEKGGHATRIPLQLEPQIRLFGLHHHTGSQIGSARCRERVFSSV